MWVRIRHFAARSRTARAPPAPNRGARVRAGAVGVDAAVGQSVGAVAAGVPLCVHGRGAVGQVERPRGGECAGFRDRNMGGSSSAQGVHGPRAHTGPPCLRHTCRLTPGRGSRGGCAAPHPGAAGRVRRSRCARRGRGCLLAPRTGGHPPPVRGTPGALMGTGSSRPWQRLRALIPASAGTARGPGQGVSARSRRTRSSCARGRRRPCTCCRRTPCRTTAAACLVTGRCRRACTRGCRTPSSGGRRGR